MFRDLWRYRRYIAVNAVNDLKSRHIGTTLGWGWVLLPSLALIVVYSVVFSQVMPVPKVGLAGSSVSFAIYLACGLLVWVGFSESLSRGTQSLLESAPYLKKLPIRESVFVAKSVASGLLVLLISLALLAVVAPLMGHFPSLVWFALIPVAALLCGMAFGMSCVLAALNVFFRDVGQALGIALQIWMWLVPVVYVETIVPDWMRGFFWYNPVYPFLVASRDIFLGYHLPDGFVWSAMAGWMLLSIVVGLSVLKSVRGDLRDCL